MDGYVTIGTDLDLSGVEKKMDQMINILEKKSNQAGQNAGKAMSSSMSKGLALGVGVFSNIVGKVMNAIESSISGAISRVDTINNFPRVMASLGINSKDAAESVDYLSEKLIGLPTTLDQGVSAVQRFTSANENVKASTEMFLALNNAILAGGAPTMQQAAALEQLSQAYAKGRPDMMEWRTAMSTMPAQLKQVAAAMGYVDASQLGEALRKGNASMNDFMLTLVKMNKTSLNGFETLEEQARKGTGGIGTALTNLKTTIVRAVGEILQTIGQANIASFFQSITNAIKASIPYIAAFVKSFMAAVTAIISVIGKIGGAISGLFGKKAKKQADKTSSSIGNVSYAVGGIGDSADKSTKAAKKLNKELGNLQGFDEMNVLQDNSNVGADSSGGESADVDTSGIGDLAGIGDLGLDKLGKKMKDLALDTDLFTAAVWGLIGAWGAFKITKLINDLGGLGLSLGTIARIALGVGIAIAGLVLLIQDFQDYLKNPSMGNFGKVIRDIGIIIAGVAIAFGAWPVAAAAAMMAILGIIISNWGKIKEIFNKAIEWLTQQMDKVKEKYGVFASLIIKAIRDQIKNIRDYLDTVFKKAKDILDNIISFFKNVFAGNWKAAWKNVTNIAKDVFDIFVAGLKFKLNTIKNMIVGAFGAIGGLISGILKGAINSVFRYIENKINTAISLFNSVLSAVNKLPGVSIGKVGYVHLPRLAKGGIVNMPGKGVMMGNYIAGERGAEGVIPLTDSQQMALLGEAIGKYITINLTNVNQMNGRVISREIQKVQNQSNFAMNR